MTCKTPAAASPPNGPRSLALPLQSLLAACAMYILWGAVLPLYWRKVTGLGPQETLAHRIVWGAVLIATTVGRKRAWSTVAEVMRDRRRRLYAIGAAALIAANWLTYIWGVRHRQITEASLGYYIGPLMSLVLGHWVLKEPLRPLQWLACAVASCGVGYLVVIKNVVPVFGLALAVTFSCYGLLRKLSGLRGMQGFIVETALLAPWALALLIWLHLRGEARFFAAPRLSQCLLMGSGVLGSLPIILFGAAAQHLPLTTLGMMQFLAPTLGLAMAVFVFGETLSGPLWLVFSSIWFSLGLWLWDGARALNRQRATQLQRSTAPSR